MKLGTMLSDILEAAIKPPATERYPFERRATPARLRGKLLWNREACTGCGLCAKDCPSGAIQVLVYDRKAKQFVFDYHVDRCLFCAQCVYSCKQDSIKLLSDDWELAALDREGYQLAWGDDADVKRFLAGELPEPPARAKKKKAE